MFRRTRIAAIRIAAVTLALLAGAVSSVRAAEVTFDDTARFLAGMQPSADSPLVPLTKDPSWQHHAKFFDGTYGRNGPRRGRGPIGTTVSSHVRNGPDHPPIIPKAMTL